MIAPLLPGSERLIEELSGKVTHIRIDRLNYFYATRITRKTIWNGQRKIFFHSESEGVKRRI
jgi:hypothetical protein